eukprot:TRINITY_DN4356_c0_g1_i1.p2 TRINITY_DN4356_c0_g1~~TRINITY_DN4356_c0_g1_i1.p2  ORF type:complete len:154 (-),score=50.74 TRINITY_DN4356_c0_g1_i1:169-609(-)
MFASARRLLQPTGVVKSVFAKFALLEFTEGEAKKTALLLPTSATPALAGRNVAFEICPSEKIAGKNEAKGLRLCDAASATGTIKFYDPVKGFGYVVSKDRQETLVHHSQIADLGQYPTKLKKQGTIEFDVEPNEKGLRASNVRRVA